ncbi:uncharacterized protein IWZ02DRAFT_466572 [Phyllosticta citriasiana]
MQRNIATVAGPPTALRASLPTASTTCRCSFTPDLLAEVSFIAIQVFHGCPFISNMASLFLVVFGAILLLFGYNASSMMRILKVEAARMSHQRKTRTKANHNFDICPRQSSRKEPNLNMDVKTATAQQQEVKPQEAPSSSKDSSSTESTPVTTGKLAANNKLSIEELLTVPSSPWDLLKEKVERITRRYIDCCNASLDKIERPEFYYSFEIEDSLEQWGSVALDLRQTMNKMTKLQLYQPDNDAFETLLQALTTMISQWKTVRDNLANTMPSTSINEE